MPTLPGSPPPDAQRHAGFGGATPPGYPASPPSEPRPAPSPGAGPRKSLRTIARRVSKAARSGRALQAAARSATPEADRPRRATGDDDALTSPADSAVSVQQRRADRQNNAAQEKARHEARKRETQQTLKAIAEQQQRWEDEDAALAQWEQMQRKKIDRIDVMLKGGSKFFTRELSWHERENLLKMKMEIFDEVGQRKIDTKQAREAEGRLELTAEQKCVLYGIDAGKRQRVRAESDAAKRREAAQLRRLESATGSVMSDPLETSLPLQPMPSGMSTTSVETVGDRIGRVEAELKRSALEKNAAYSTWEERWELDNREHQKWVTAQEKRADELAASSRAALSKARQAAGDVLADPPEEVVRLDAEVAEIRKAVQLREWQHGDRRRWEREQLPALTEDERRVLRGIESAAKMREERRRHFNQKAGPSGRSPSQPKISPLAVALDRDVRSPKVLAPLGRGPISSPDSAPLPPLAPPPAAAPRARPVTPADGAGAKQHSGLFSGESAAPTEAQAAARAPTPPTVPTPPLAPGAAGAALRAAAGADPPLPLRLLWRPAAGAEGLSALRRASGAAAPRPLSYVL